MAIKVVLKILLLVHPNNKKACFPFFDCFIIWIYELLHKSLDTNQVLLLNLDWSRWSFRYYFRFHNNLRRCHGRDSRRFGRDSCSRSCLFKILCNNLLLKYLFPWTHSLVLRLYDLLSDRIYDAPYLSCSNSQSRVHIEHLFKKIYWAGWKLIRLWYSNCPVYLC